MADFRTVEAGSTLARGFTLVARASGNPITAGTVSWYVKSLTGVNAGKWWRDSDQTWQAGETANAMTHQADGHWTRDLAASPWSDGVLYLEYAKESGDLHVPISRTLVAAYTPSADSNRRVDVGKVGGTVQTAGDLADRLATIAGYLDTEISAILTAVDTEIAAIKLKTDLIPADPASASDVTDSEAVILAAVGDPLQDGDYTAPDNAGIAALVLRLTAARALLLDNLTRLDQAISDLPTAAEIDTQLSEVHGAGAWGAPAGVGANTVVITVVDDATDLPLSDVLVTVKTTDGTIRDQGRSDGDGEFSTSLNDGSYTVSANPIPGYSAVADQAFPVDEDPEAVEVRMQALTVSAPSSSSFCTLFIDVFEDATTPAEGVLLTATPVTLPHLLTSAILSGEERTATTDSDGRAELQLARGKQYRVKLPKEGVNRVITVPSAASANLRTLL